MQARDAKARKHEGAIQNCSEKAYQLRKELNCYTIPVMRRKYPELHLRAFVTSRLRAFRTVLRQ
jgi:hypothetical protein